jgi:hypothetical protein
VWGLIAFGVFAVLWGVIGFIEVRSLTMRRSQSRSGWMSAATGEESMKLNRSLHDAPADDKVRTKVARRPRRPTPRSGAANDIEISVGELPLIPPGRYDAVGAKAFVLRVHGATKLCVLWTVLVPNPAADYGITKVKLYRYYNVRHVSGRRFHVGPHTAYAREATLVAGRRLRRDRLSSRIFERVLCSVEVATVTHDARQRLLPEGARYSRIARIIARQAGGSQL